MRKTISLVLIFSLSLSALFVFPSQVFAHDLPVNLDLGYYITPNDPSVENIVQVICGSNINTTDFWTKRSNVENLYHWVAGSVPHGIPTHIHYASDQNSWGVTDYWQLSNTTLSLGHGDDEDQAILLASLTRAAGVPRENVRIVRYGVYRLEFPWWGFGLISFEKERVGSYCAVEVFDISSHPTNLWYHDWWTPLHPIATNLLGWPMLFSSCEWLGNSAFENPVCARRLKPEATYFQKETGEPKASFTYYPLAPCVNMSVKFDASTSTPDGGNITGQTWDFGDGSPLMNLTDSSFSNNLLPVFHTYIYDGDFGVNLTIFDSEARSSSISKTIHVESNTDDDPPIINVSSPQNITYMTGLIDLNFTTNEPASWVGCTVDDGQYVANATVFLGQTLNFTEGSHNIQLFANDTSGNMGASEKIYFTVELSSELHDVAVIAVNPYRSWVYQGTQAQMNTTIANYGDVNETVTVKLYYNITAGQLIDTRIIYLAPNENETLTFGWNTLGVQYCHNYTITGVAEVEQDIDLTNNLLESSLKVKVRIPGDVNGNGGVDLSDAIIAANSFGSYPRHPGWNEAADINEDQIIDIFDLILIGNNFGKIC